MISEENERMLSSMTKLGRIFGSVCIVIFLLGFINGIFDEKEKKSENIITESNEETDIGNIVLGNKFVCSDNSEIHMNEDGSYIYYYSKDEHDIAYFRGTYEVFCGQPAVDKIVSMEKYGVIEEEIEYIINNNKKEYHLGDVSGQNSLIYMLEEAYGEEFSEKKNYPVSKDVFYCIILHNELLYMEGVTEEVQNDTVYVGYYIDEIEALDLLNVEGVSSIMWILQ